MAYDIGNRIMLCSFLGSSNLLIVNSDLNVVNYEIKCVRKWYSANMRFAKSHKLEIINSEPWSRCNKFWVMHYGLYFLRR